MCCELMFHSVPDLAQRIWGGRANKLGAYSGIRAVT
jgi:hypothetical protein